MTNLIDELKRYDFDKETDKEFLREAGKFLQDTVLQLLYEKENLILLKISIEEVKNDLSGQLLVLRKKIFDKKAEKKEKLKEIKKEKKKKKTNLPHNQNENKNTIENNSETSTIETKEVIHEKQDNTCPDCGKEKLKEINNLFSESNELGIVSSYYILKIHKRKTYKCECCKKIVKAKGPQEKVPESKFSLELGVDIAIKKYSEHLPLERQRKAMNEKGVNISVKSLFRILESLYFRLNGIEKLNFESILKGTHVNIDESPFNFFNPTISKGQVWSISNNIGAYYQFEPTKSSAVAKELLKNYKGAVVSDCYAGYKFLNEIKDIDHGGCWSHLRRKFFEAMLENEVAGEIVDLIDDLYNIEHQAINLQEIKCLRETRSKLIFENIKSWIYEESANYLESSLTRKAINYFINNEKEFSAFLSNENLPLDNNGAERALRDSVMGKKNYLFFKSINGADMSMFYYSIIRSCKINGLNPRTYLLEMGLRSLKSEELESPFSFATKLKNKIQNQLNNQIDNFKEKG